jgi:RNA polymerase sigma factor (sigma-70 family)
MLTGGFHDSVMSTQTVSRPASTDQFPSNRTQQIADIGECDVGDVVLAYQHGQSEALEVLMRHFQRRMECVARRYLWCRHDVEDAVQDAWVAFAQSAQTIRTPMAIGAWLCTTTTRTALAIARRQARCRPAELPERDLPHDSVGIAQPDDVGHDEELVAVHQAVGRLSDKDREFVSMVFGSTLSYFEITARTGRAVGGIGPTRQRVIAKLRQDRSIRRLLAARTV